MVQRAALYTRVSTTDQSCDRQVAELTSYANRAGFEIVDVMKEIGSGAKNDRVKRKVVLDMARKPKLTWFSLLSCPDGDVAGPTGL
jgi:predicted site-specific integrase-resolvase